MFVVFLARQKDRQYYVLSAFASHKSIDKLFMENVRASAIFLFRKLSQNYRKEVVLVSGFKLALGSDTFCG